MRKTFCFAVFFVISLPLSGGRPYFNDLEAPETMRDVKAIQAALQAILPRIRAATVSVNLGGGFGSAVIVSPEGLVLTAAHVVGGVGRELDLIMEDGRRAKAVSLGLVSTTDCAMARITEKTGKPWPFVEIEREDTARRGDWVTALGYSGGFDKSRGVVVRLGRLVRMGETACQSDCRLIGGDSGGGLFDMEGRLIGIHSRVAAAKDDNKHVPMKEFLKHWEAMARKEFVGDGPFARRQRSGSAFLGLFVEEAEGGSLRVRKVLRKSPAKEAGFKEGDILNRLNGKDLKGEKSFREALLKLAPGEKVKLDCSRDGKNIEIEMRPGKPWQSIEKP